MEADKSAKQQLWLAGAATLALLIASGSVLWAVTRVDSGNNSTIAKQLAAPLSADQRIERARYLARWLGLGFGVPLQARAMAVDKMHQMKTAQ